MSRDVPFVTFLFKGNQNLSIDPYVVSYEAIGPYDANKVMIRTSCMWHVPIHVSLRVGPVLSHVIVVPFRRSSKQ